MTGRPDLATYRHREDRKTVLAISDVCILCGHRGSDAADHVIPVSRGGDPGIGNMAPIHGNKGCPVCGRKCNAEKGDKLLSEITRLVTSRDWYAFDLVLTQDMINSTPPKSDIEDEPDLF